ncbi:hypothetical protein FGADI_12243 [Fusarium gaditjirri]|uniref:Uncharacterized protein n=1 Tax=Fusarium gaditjirri TaxID=282569 RepID=A0A8H4ST28_9HYPO|nr:hypothetical protein FGADI_12243 [Fusarium gaditjirri]
MDNNYEDNNVGPLRKSLGNVKQPARTAPANGRQERATLGAGSFQHTQLPLDLLGSGSVETTVSTGGLANSNTGSDRNLYASQSFSMAPRTRSASNKRAWNAIFDEWKEEGQDLQVLLCSTNTPVMKAVEAKRRRVGNTSCNIFEGLPALPEPIHGLPQPLPPAVPLLIHSPPPPETVDEPSTCAGDGSRDGSAGIYQSAQMTCVGCGSHTNSLTTCFRAGPDGVVIGCYICNTLEHNLIRCRKFKKKTPMSKMLSVVTRRKRMPTCMAWTKDVIDARDAEDLPRHAFRSANPPNRPQSTLLLTTKSATSPYSTSLLNPCATSSPSIWPALHNVEAVKRTKVRNCGGVCVASKPSGTTRARAYYKETQVPSSVWKLLCYPLVLCSISRDAMPGHKASDQDLSLLVKLEDA